jgi:hypothetical protein
MGMTPYDLLATDHWSLIPVFNRRLGREFSPGSFRAGLAVYGLASLSAFPWILVSVIAF